MIYRDTNIQAARAAGNFNTRRDSSGGRGGGRRGGGAGGPMPLVRFTPAGGGTFTRASEASYYLSPPNTTGGFLAWAGVNTIREDRRDGVAGGYLFEPSRANFCFYSELLSDASWSKNGGTTITGTTAIAPDGDADACTVTFTAAATDSISRAQTGLLDATGFGLAVWVRKTSGTGNVRLRIVSRDGAPVTTTTADIPISTTWKRIETFLASWGTGVSVPQIHLLNDVAGTAQSIEVWGFQIDRLTGGPNAVTSYVRTAAASATRAADNLTFATYPEVLRSGRWSYRCASSFANTETGVLHPAYGFDSDSYAGVQSANVVMTAGATRFSKICTYARDQLMTMTVDCQAMQSTVAGALTGDGIGTVGAATLWPAGTLRVGANIAASRVFYGRVWEPYNAPVAPLLSFASGTFTRASEASYHTRAPDTVGGFLAWAGNDVLREDQRDGQRYLYLFEGARTNICYWSEDLSQALWVKNGGTTITGSTATAPDGEADARTVTFTALATDSLSQLIQPATTNSLVYMASVWVRKTSGTGNVRLRVTDRAGAAVTSADLSISTTWKLIELAANSGIAGPGAMQIELLNDVAGTAQSIETWGFQLELRNSISVGTSYIRTLGAASATRPADVLTYASGVPAAMRSGKWLWRQAPLNSSGDSGAGGVNGSWLFSATQSDFVGGAGNPDARVNNVSQFSKVGGSFARNQILTLQLDMAAAIYTMQGWTTANGAGAAGTPVSFGDYLQLSAPAGARMSEPYAWV